MKCKYCGAELRLPSEIATLLLVYIGKVNEVDIVMVSCCQMSGVYNELMLAVMSTWIGEPRN